MEVLRVTVVNAPKGPRRVARAWGSPKGVFVFDGAIAGQTDDIEAAILALAHLEAVRLFLSLQFLVGSR